MSKICSRCGAQLDDATVFCGNCGSSVESQPQTQNVFNNAPVTSTGMATNEVSNNTGYYAPMQTVPQKNKSIKWIIIAVAAVLVAVVAWIFISDVCFSPEDVVKKTVNSIEKRDFNKLKKIAWDVYDSPNADDFYEDGIESGFDDILEYFEEELGFGYKLSYEITDTDIASSKELREFKNNAKSELADQHINYDVNKIKELRAFEVKITATSKGESKKVNAYIVAVKEGNFSWKLGSFSW